MADVYHKNLSSDQSQNYTDTNYSCEYSHLESIILTYVIIGICLPITPVAIYSLYTQVKNGGPIYVINLLISNLIHLCCVIDWFTVYLDMDVLYIRFILFSSVYICSLMARIHFLVCVALDRYLVIAYPVWYQDTQTIKISVVICFAVWSMSIFLAIQQADFFAFLLLYLPLLLFLLIGTFKALFAANSVPYNEKRQTAAILVVVLVIWLLLLLPELIFRIMMYLSVSISFYCIYNLVNTCNPLADLVLYLCINKYIDKLVARLCCCRNTCDGINRLSV